MFFFFLLSSLLICFWFDRLPFAQLFGSIIGRQAINHIELFECMQWYPSIESVTFIHSTSFFFSFVHFEIPLEMAEGDPESCNQIITASFIHRPTHWAKCKFDEIYNHSFPSGGCKVDTFDINRVVIQKWWAIKCQP